MWGRGGPTFWCPRARIEICIEFNGVLVQGRLTLKRFGAQSGKSPQVKIAISIVLYGALEHAPHV